MNDSLPQLFSYQSSNVRVIMDGDEPWFVASDVAKILEYRMASDMTRRLPAEDKGTRSVRTPSGMQQMTVITYPGVFEAIFRSEADGSRRFRYWLTHEVLPAIQKNGFYSATPAPAPLTGMDLMAAAVLEANKHMKAQNEVIAEQKEVIAELAVKAEFTDKFIHSGSAMSIQEVSHLFVSEGFDMGEYTLFRWLRNNGWLDKQNRPKKPVIKQGLLKVKLSTHIIGVRYGQPVYGRSQVLVTPKGLEELRQCLFVPHQLQIEAPVRTVRHRPEIEAPARSTRVLSSVPTERPSSGRRERRPLTHPESTRRYS